MVMKLKPPPNHFRPMNHIYIYIYIYICSIYGVYRQVYVWIARSAGAGLEWSQGGLQLHKPDYVRSMYGVSIYNTRLISKT